MRAVNSELLKLRRRGMYIGIALMALLAGGVSTLLTILKRGNDRVSQQAGYALDDLVDHKSARHLIPIADGTFVPAQPRSVRVSALRGLVNTIWSVAEALPIAKKIVRSADFLDWSLAERVRAHDVKDGLKALAGCNRIFDSLFRLRRTAMCLRW